MKAAIDMAGLGRQLAKWSLDADGKAFATPSSTIAFVRRGEMPAVLKLFKPTSDEARSPRILLRYDGHGTVRVLAHDESAVLLERAVPGTPLSTLVRDGKDDEALVIICDVAGRLHRHGMPSEPQPTVENLGEAFARYRNGPMHALLPQSLVDEAEPLYFALCRTQTNRVLLHGDLHHDNILFDARRGWLAIDPKGVVGEPQFELGAALRNPRVFAAAGDRVPAIGL
jgi:streptomycin 6-kinase